MNAVIFIVCAALAGLLTPVAAQTADDHKRAVARLAEEADKFDKSAHRVTGIETYRQTQPAEARVDRRGRTVAAAKPAFSREIVSEYGFVSLDERGGWFKEARMVLTVDGAPYKKSRKGLDTLARTLSANDDRKKRSLLESLEDLGLRGVITDLGQLILLFARGLVQNYEITYMSSEPSPQGLLWVYRYNQINGSDALTIYEGKEPIRQTLHGQLWVRASDATPVKISVESERQAKGGIVHDISQVVYDRSNFGFLLPKVIRHDQYINRQLFVRDEFVYSDFKDAFAAPVTR